MDNDEKDEIKVDGKENIDHTEGKESEIVNDTGCIETVDDVVHNISHVLKKPVIGISVPFLKKTETRVAQWRWRPLGKGGAGWPGTYYQPDIEC